MILGFFALAIFEAKRVYDSFKVRNRGVGFVDIL